MPTTVRYKSGLAAVFSSEDEARAQAAHDNGQPGNDKPAYIMDGDQSERHASWGRPDPPPDVNVLAPRRDTTRLRCGCSHCEFQRQAPKAKSGADRLTLLEDLGLAPKPPMAGGGVPGAGYAVTLTAVALTAATAKTIMAVLTGANTPVDLVEFAVSCDGTSGNMLVELVYGTNATNPPGTASTSFTPLQIRGPVQALNSTAGITWTTEPTVLTVLKRWRWPLPGGPLLVQWPLGREPNSIPTAATAGKFFGIRVASSVGSNTDGYLEIEE